MITTKRAYDPPDSRDGVRVIVDRIRPRGVKKSDIAIDVSIKVVAPSSELRKWFGHDPEKWAEFRKRYSREIDQKIEVLAPARAGS